MYRRLCYRTLFGVALCIIGLLSLGVEWQTCQGLLIVAAPLVWAWALFSFIAEVAEPGLPESFEDAFGFEERRVDAQDYTDHRGTGTSS